MTGNPIDREIVTCGNVVGVYLPSGTDPKRLVAAYLQCLRKPGHDGDHSQTFAWKQRSKNEI